MSIAKSLAAGPFQQDGQRDGARPGAAPAAADSAVRPNHPGNGSTPGPPQIAGLLIVAATSPKPPPPASRAPAAPHLPESLTALRSLLGGLWRAEPILRRS